MTAFRRITNKQGEIIALETNLTGANLLNTPKLNKASAFTNEERELFNLFGRLPYHVETLSEQVARKYQQYAKKSTALQKNIFLNTLLDTNEILFYKLVGEHLKEMLPILYTPTVGQAVEEFSQEFRRPRGLYLSYPDHERIDSILENRIDPEVDLVVMTDGERILGIGDQGVGGIAIPIAKLMVYTLCAGIDPNRVLPIQIDVGTNNKKLIADPMYLGWRHERLSGEKYDDFINRIVQAIKQKFPNVFLHWEDFGRENARRNLMRFREQLCTFNDDIQGTGAVTLAAILAAVNAAKSNLVDQRIVIYGAGTAGAGVADQIFDAMLRLGHNEKEARAHFWLIDRQGLLTESSPDTISFQKPYLRANSEIAAWKVKDSHNITLAEVVAHVKPTILIGCSTQGGAFTEDVIRMMAKYVAQPIIFPLSNPTEKSEAIPSDLLAWTDGKALIATGSPFEDVNYKGRRIRISQCNNAFVFPGIGLGVINSKPRLLTNTMIWAACQALAEQSPAKLDPTAPILPDVDEARQVCIKVGIAVATKAREEGLAQISPDVDLTAKILAYCWEPKYYPYRKV
jgi:malate dehydrogenase (oxaloacetate-decarboxylating)